MMTAEQDFGKVRIVGVSTTRQARSLVPASGLSLAMQAIQGALDDAGMRLSEVDAVLGSPVGWPPHYAAISGGFQGYWARQLGQPMKWGSEKYGVSALLEAAALISTGLIKTAVVITAQSGSGELSHKQASYQEASEFTAWTGSFTPAQYALVAQRWAHERGPKVIEAMAEASATIRNFGHINPDALYFGRPTLSASDILASRMIASPLTLLMCCANCDGAGAVLLTSANHARDCAKPPISILCGGEYHYEPPYVGPPFLHDPRPARDFALRCFAGAGVSPQDFDVLQLYDNFAINVLDQLETFGICEIGESQEFILSGALGLQGTYPTCTDGGLMAFGHLGGYLYRVVEAVRQLRGDVRDLCPEHELGSHTHNPMLCRKVENVELALVGNPGAPGGGTHFSVLARRD